MDFRLKTLHYFLQVTKHLSALGFYLSSIVLFVTLGGMAYDPLLLQVKLAAFMLCCLSLMFLLRKKEVYE